MSLVEDRLQRLEDIEAIRKLKAKFTHMVDAAYSPDVADLFTDDGVIEAGPFGGCRGRADIRRYFTALPASHHFSLHYVSNPSIEIEPSGVEAEATWYLWQPNTAVGDKGDEAIIIAGMYHDNYRRVSGEWLISSLRVEFSFITPYDVGWVRQRFVR